MNDLRRTIMEWVRANDCSGAWVFDLYCHLMGQGASSNGRYQGA